MQVENNTSDRCRQQFNLIDISARRRPMVSIHLQLVDQLYNVPDVLPAHLKTRWLHLDSRFATVPFGWPCCLLESSAPPS